MVFLHYKKVCKSINTKIPYFNAPVFLENKTQIGKVDEILGPINEVFFTVKLQDGVVAASFKVSDKVYIGTDKLLPLDRFLPKPAVVGGNSKATGRQGMMGDRGRGRGRGDRGRGIIITLYILYFIYYNLILIIILILMIIRWF